MKKIAFLSLIMPVIGSASLIGVEDFNFPDGLIADQTTGTGWAWDNLNTVQTATISDWDNVGGTPSVTGGALTTLGQSAKREYNGNVEGAAGGDGPETERAGAMRGVGVVYYSVQMTRSPGADWSGVSSYDFGNERIFFGIPGSQTGTRFFGIVETGPNVRTLSTVPVVEGQTYYLVSKLDFDNSLLSLWIDPVLGGEGANAPIATQVYTGTNWSTAARLGSGGSAATTWDDLRVGTTWDDVVVGVVPEPSILSLSLVGILMLAARARRR